MEYERKETDLKNIEFHRDDDNRKYSQDIEKLNNEISVLKTNEMSLLKNIDELKQELFIITSERNEIHEQNENYLNEIENIQRLLLEETESSSKSASKVVLLTRQLDDEQKRSNDSINQLNDVQLKLQSALITNETLKTELSQARLLLQGHADQV